MLDHNTTALTMVCLTIYTLFFDDLRVILFPIYCDKYFYGISSCCLVIFSTEIFLQCFAVQGYFLSFFFWLDSVATFSMVSDIEWIWDIINSAS